MSLLQRGCLWALTSAVYLGIVTGQVIFVMNDPEFGYTDVAGVNMNALLVTINLTWGVGAAIRAAQILRQYLRERSK